MKKTQSPKGTVVIIERRKLPLDFYFDALSDGQKIKKVRMLDTDAETETLTHIIRVVDTLGKENLTINHHDNQTNHATNKYLNQDIEEHVDIEGLHEISTEDSDAVIDVEAIDDENDQQTEAMPKTNQDDLAQSVTTLHVANDHKGDNDTVKKPTASDLNKDEAPLSPPTTTKGKAKAMPTSTQEADTAKPVVNGQSTSTTNAANASDGLVVNKQHQCHLCAELLPDFFQLTVHYYSAHNVTIPMIARFPHLQPDPCNINNFCQMCDRQYKHRATYIAHLRKMHRMSVSNARRAPIPPTLADLTLVENVNDKALNFKSETFSKSRNATPSLTPPDSNATPTVPNDVQSNANSIAIDNIQNNIPTIPVNDNKNNTLPTPSIAQTKTATPTSTVQNDDITIKFVMKDGLMTHVIPVPSSPTQVISNQSTVAIAASSEIAPIPTMQPDPTAPYPDLQDPNNYCKCCDKTLSTQKSYIQHCRKQHQIPLPDPDDPNFFCKVCNMKNPDLFTYRKHMRVFHQMKEFPEMLDIDCYHCKRTFTNEKTYGAHLRKVARKEKELQLIEKRPPPIWDDPNFHCSKCLKTFESDGQYKAHLRSVHDISAKFFKGINSMQSDGHHSNEIVGTEDAVKDHFFCFACRKEYFDRLKYDQHLKKVHTLDLGDAVLDALRIASSPKTFAKPLDPTLYYFMMKSIGHVHSD